MSEPILPALPDPAAIDRALRRDRPALRRLRRRVATARRQGRPHDRNLTRLLSDLERSREARATRAASVPRPSWPAELPVVARRDEIATAIAAHQVVVVCGETGSGKSTQLPKILLDMGYGVDGLIGHTQPRRLAARSLARRIAEELDVELGGPVGFQVRFTDQTDARTLIKLMTDGVLLNETRRDRDLQAYDALIIDEAHERSLNIDFLLGYLHRLLPRRPDLRVVITSATIEHHRFAEHFGREVNDELVPAPVIEVSGRTYPVNVRWCPPEAEDGQEPDVLAAVADAVDEAVAADEGDVLVFLPTQRDIHEAARLLRGRRHRRPVEILPLYARLPPETQQRIFAGGGARRVVLATNVAETSLTVPGITTVIDTGTARVSRFSPRAHMQRLPIEPIARASADQRKGRCGRVAPGTCVRLYSQEDFDQRDAQPTPEILRSNLASVVLRMADLGLGEVSRFPFLDPPRKGMVRAGLDTLIELGALDDDEQLTDVGRLLARLPVDPRIGRMVLAGHDEGCLAEVLIVAAALESSDPRERPVGKEKAADRVHARLLDGDSDFTSLLTLWDHVRASRDQAGSHRRWEAALRAQFLSPARCREWFDVHRQLRDLAAEAGLRPGPRRDDRSALHRALLTGLLSHVAERCDTHDYRGTDGKPLWIWPGSALFDNRPRWIVAAEIVETTRRYARTVARIDPQLVEELAGDRVERSWRDPWWERAAGQVLALEKVAFHGLTLVPRRRVRYDRIDPVVSRELFIRHALAEGQLESNAPFLAHNLKLVNDVAALEARTRRRGLLADLDARYDFYDRLLPPEVTGATSFHHWRRRAEKHDRGVLFMSLDDLLREDPGAEARQAHPDHLDLGGMVLPLRYRLEPGAEDDGVTATVTVADLPRLDARRLEWLVPGLLREKCIALVRGLPKPVRKLFVPVPTRVDEALAFMSPSDGSLLPSLARALQRTVGQPVSVRRFDTSRLPDALRMRIEVVDEAGRVLAAGRDVAALRDELGSRAALAEAEAADARWHRDGLLRWDEGELPERVTLPDGRSAHPMFVDQGEGVGVRLTLAPDEARRRTREALLRLALNALGGSLRHRIHRHRAWRDMALHHATLGGSAELERALIEVVVRESVLAGPDGGVVRDAATWAARLDEGKRHAPAVLDHVLDAVGRVLEAWHTVRRRLDELATTPLAPAAAAVEPQLTRLLADGWLARTPVARLPHLPRYLAAVDRRLERMTQRGTLKDAELEARLAPHEAALAELTAEHAERRRPSPALERLRWALEEYRVSIFAQELGTDGKISDKRLRHLAAEARADLAR